MRIFLNNKDTNYALQFNNVKLNKEVIYISHNYPDSMGIPNYKINYNTFMELLTDSFIIYMEQKDIDIDIDNSLSDIDTLFTYFKITSNPFIKKQMVSKISAIFIKLLLNSDSTEPMKLLIQSYKSYKIDIYYNYLLILLNLNNIEVINIDNNLKNDFYIEDEYFSFMDFILDYNLE